MGKFVTVINKIIKILFIILISSIVFSTTIIDKNIDNPFLNTVAHRNVLYYLIALFIGGGYSIVNCYNKHSKLLLDGRRFYTLVVITAVIISLWQAFCVIWMPDVGGADFANVKNAAMGLANGEKFWTYSYFSTSINNANIAIFLSVLYRIIPTWTGIVFIGALFTNFSAVFVSLTIRNYTKNNKLSLLCLWGSELILAMTWRAYLVYTDNFGMLFVAMTLWIISLKLKYQIKIPLVIVFISFASYIKVTNFLLFLCLVIYYFCNHIGENTKDNLKKILYGFICFCVIFGGVIGGQKILRHHYELMQDEYAKGWQYMFMVGQNTEAFGVVNGNDGDIRVKFIDMYESGAEVRLACRDEAFARIRERRVVGNMKYYLCKLDVAYGDGYFHNIHTTDEYNRSDFFSKIYMLDGKWYWVLANLLQIVWNGILLSLLAGAWINKKTNNIINLYYLFILAVTLYLLCFEGRSKYIYVFTYIHSSGGIIV